MSATVKKGTCTRFPPNECTKAHSKELQTAPVNNFFCSECGWALREVRDTKNWPIIAGIGLVVTLGIGVFASYKYWSSQGSVGVCPSENLNDFLAQSPPPELLLQAAKSCLAEAKTVNDIGTAARLCRNAADAGKPEGALCLGELYDPKDVKPGRVGQMPSADFQVAFDNYRHAKELGSPEASTKLAELKPFVEAKAAEGDRIARDLLERWPD